MSSVICPECDSNDRVESIVTVITGGTSVGVDLSTTFGFTGGGRGASFLTTTSSFHQTRLASRFYPPFRHPEEVSANKIIAWLLIAPILMTWFLNVITGRDGAEAIVWGAIYWILSGLITLICMPLYLWAHPLFVQERTREWNRRYNAVGNGYYCYRDDVAFNDSIYGSPEHFTYEVFRGA